MEAVTEVIEVIGENPVATIILVYTTLTIIKKLLTAYKEWAKKADWQYAFAQRLIKATGDIAGFVHTVIVYVTANDGETDNKN